MKKVYNAYICSSILGVAMKKIGAFNTSKAAKAAAKAAYEAGGRDANGEIAGAYAWQSGKSRAFSFSWE